MSYNIISTGSKGNAVVIKNFVLVDCGVSFKALFPVYKQIKIILLTHIHSDHFNKVTIRRLAIERPTLRFACGSWLVQPLIDCGVSIKNIDVVEPAKIYNYGIVTLEPVALQHNVENIGYKLNFNGYRVFYATDTNNLNGITAPNYDLYMVEANHTEEEIKQRISDKKMNGEYAYEVQAMRNHLSKEKADDFIFKNCGPNSEYVYLHCHEDRR